MTKLVGAEEIIREENEILNISKSALKIIKHFGPIHQYQKLVEEASEVIDALNGDDYQNVVEEFGDIFLVLLQFYNIDENMRKSVNEKCNRTLELIK